MTEQAIPCPPDRIACCIPLCRRTFKRQSDDGPFREVICGKHYRMAGERIRKMRRKIAREIKKGACDDYLDRLLEIDDWAWQRIKRQVVAALGGQRL